MSNKYPGGFVSLGGPIKSYSNYFNGSAYLSTTSSANLQPGSSDFCVEAWVYPTIVGSSRAIYSANDNSLGTNLEFRLYYSTSGVFAYYYATSGYLSQISTATPLVANQWSHVAWSRSGSTVSLFVNGLRVATGSISGGSSASTAYAYVGNFISTPNWQVTGYLSNVRFVKGSSVYTPSDSSIVVPTTPFNPVTNTQLLTCQSSTIVDNSSNTFTLTNTGGITVDTFQPNFQAYNPNNLDPALGAATPGIWTLDQALNAEVTRSWPMYDPYYKNVVLNLHGEGTNGAQNNTFVDSSASPLTITRNGHTTQGSFSPYGSNWSNYFDGTGDYLTNTTYALITQTVSTFTAEAWVFMTANPTSDANYLGSMVSLDGEAANTTNYLSFGPISTRKLRLRWFDGASKYAEGSTTLNLNTWYHIAVVVTSNSIAMYVNGVAETLSGTTTLTNRSGTASDFSVGANYYSTFWGYISNLRVTTTAVYSSAFTPSTTPLTAITNTVLLTCQSNRFIDNSTNAYSLTVGGTPSVQRFQPFLFNTSYTPSTIGGSGYFDGTGDYLNTATSANLAIGSGNMTIECWFYPLVPSASRQQWLFDFRTSGSESTTRLYAYIGESDGILYAGFGGFDDQASGTPIKNAWNHMAIVRSGSGSNNVAVYLNGTRTKQLTDTTNFSTSTQAYVGKRYLTPGSIEYMVGYLCDTRFVKGTAVYDPSVSTLTLPTAPLTAITNTQLLLGYTNSGIVDNAMMNDLATVGNAQISTSVKKYGTGSMYFDGSGDYLYINKNQPLTLGSGDFTVECWVYFTSVSGTQVIIDDYDSAATGWQLWINASVIKFYSGTANLLSGTTTLTTGNWYHVAVSRSGSSLKMFLNGAVEASTTSSVAYTNATNPVLIGGQAAGGPTSYLFGYIDDLRITKGVARYVANFTPPTSQLQDQ